MTPPRLRTTRLLLRPLERGDAPAIAEIAGKFEVSKWLIPVPHPYGLAGANAFLDRALAGEEGPIWAITENHNMVGMISVDDVLGYYLDPAQWGRGLMTEAVLTALSWRFSDAAVTQITSGCFNGNDASFRVLSKAGFVETDKTTMNSLARGEDVPSRRMKLLRSTWQAQSAPRVISYRVPRTRDFTDYHALVSVWDVARNLGSWPWPSEQDFTRARCRPYQGDGFVWAICIADQLIGTVAVTEGVLGYMLHPNYQGQGVVSRAMQDALREAFETYALKEVKADIWADNAISKHMLTKAGFDCTGQTMEHALARDARTASETYVLTRETWQACRG